MSNVAELSKAGNLADLEVVLEVADTQRQFLLALWALAVSVVLQGAQAGSGAASVVASMVEEVEADSEEASKIVEALAVEEEVLDTKVGVASLREVDMEETVVGTADQMDTVHLLTLQLAQVVRVVVAMAAVGPVEEVTGALVLQTATVLALRRQLVGTTRVEAVAHMMTDPADIAAAAVEVTEIAMALPAQVVVATWSR